MIARYASRMTHALVRWLIPLLALFAVGPVAGWLMWSIVAADGSHDISVLLNGSLARAVMGLLGVVGLATLVGVAGARFVAPRSGLFAAGLVLAWGAWSTGRIDHLIANQPTNATMYTLVLEALLVGGLGVLSAFVILRVPSTPIGQDEGLPAHEREPSAFNDPSTLIALGGAAIAGAVVAFLLAQDALKGQTVFAAFAAGLVGATVGRMCSQRCSPVVFFAAIALVAILAPAAATLVHPGASGVLRAAKAGSMLALARPLPLDWMAGAFIGIPIGLAWAGSMVESRK